MSNNRTVYLCHFNVRSRKILPRIFQEKSWVQEKMCAFDVLTVYVWYQEVHHCVPNLKTLARYGRKEWSTKYAHTRGCKTMPSFCNTSHLMRGLSVIVKKFLALKMNVYIFPSRTKYLNNITDIYTFKVWLM